jgi:hypothetical protein
MGDSKFDKLYENLLEIMKDQGAARLCFDYFMVAQIWDDLIDRDKELQDHEINNAFVTALLNIPQNPFYLKFAHKIIPILEVSIYKWYKANDYEDNSKELNKAYMLRAGLYDIFAQCIIIIYGVDTKINIYDLYGEVFENYEKEIKCQIQ